MPDAAASFTSGTTIGDVGEFALVDALVQRFPRRDHVVVGPGDDAAVLDLPAGHVLVSTDLLVDTRHFRRDWASAYEIGRKAAAQNLSDINAMGGRATALTVGLATPPDLPVAWALELADGLAVEADEVGACVVGGDLTRSDAVMIAVTVLGGSASAAVLRSGARAGDVVALAGRQGWAAAGLAVLTRGFRSPRAVVEAHRRPRPPYDAGPQAALAGATAMIDLSDGLLGDVAHLAEASGVAIDIRTDRLGVAEPLRAVGAALGVDPLRFVLTGGDDYALVATFPEGTTVPAGWSTIGAVAEGSGVTVDGQVYDAPGGHEHFR